MSFRFIFLMVISILSLRSASFAGDTITSVDACWAKAIQVARQLALAEEGVASVELGKGSTAFLLSTQTTFTLNFVAKMNNQFDNRKSYLVKTINIPHGFQDKTMEYCAIDSISLVR